MDVLRLRAGDADRRYTPVRTDHRDRRYFGAGGGRADRLACPPKQKGKAFEAQPPVKGAEGPPWAVPFSLCGEAGKLPASGFPAAAAAASNASLQKRARAGAR